MLEIPEARSRHMAGVRQRHTAPELAVRQSIHKLGYRFRLHRKDLPGTPDLVLPRLRSVVFVNGCFWHRHPGCKKASTPKTRVEFWSRKFSANVARDTENIAKLSEMGWTILTIWECETTNPVSLCSTLAQWLALREEVSRQRGKAAP